MSDHDSDAASLAIASLRDIFDELRPNLVGSLDPLPAFRQISGRQLFERLIGLCGSLNTIGNLPIGRRVVVLDEEGHLVSGFLVQQDVSFQTEEYRNTCGEVEARVQTNPRLNLELMGVMSGRVALLPGEVEGIQPHVPPEPPPPPKPKHITPPPQKRTRHVSDPNE
jgi:hypothetical protein